MGRSFVKTSVSSVLLVSMSMTIRMSPNSGSWSAVVFPSGTCGILADHDHHCLEVKGGTALAEHLMKTTEGYAVAVGQMKVIISVDANKPVCDTTAPTPPVTGYVSQGGTRTILCDSTCFNMWDDQPWYQDVIVQYGSIIPALFTYLSNHLYLRKTSQVGAWAICFSDL